MHDVVQYPEDFVVFYRYLAEKIDRVTVIATRLVSLPRPDLKYIDRLEVHVKHEFASEWMKQSQSWAYREDLEN